MGVILDLGVRYETADQTVDPVDVFNTPLNSASSTAINNDYWLPAATLTVEPMENLQLRANASMTLARPQFRELIFQTYYDPETNRQFNGNPFLIDSELKNFEVRGEYYFGGGDRVSLAGFYKEIDNPIEAFSSFSDNAQLTSFANAPSATLWGVEADMQYTFDLYNLGGFFETKELLVISNYTYTNSEISVQAGDITRLFPGGDTAASNLFVDGVPLTGQSDHLVNFQMSLEDTERLQQFTVLLNYASQRVTSRGTSGLPDILEEPGLTVDLVARQGFDLLGNDVELKLEARNIFGRPNEEFQTDGVNRAEINSYERGTELAASLVLHFLRRIETASRQRARGRLFIRQYRRSDQVEHIAPAVHGAQQLPCPCLAQPLAQPLDPHIHRAQIFGIAILAQRIDQFLPRQHPVGVFGHEAQDAKLVGSQADQLAVPARLFASDVDLQIAELQYLGHVAQHAAGRTAPAPGPALPADPAARSRNRPPRLSARGGGLRDRPLPAPW